MTFDHFNIDIPNCNRTQNFAYQILKNFPQVKPPGPVAGEAIPLPVPPQDGCAIRESAKRPHPHGLKKSQFRNSAHLEE